MTIACDLCANTDLHQVYAASDSARKLTVWTCAHCGLMQSLPRTDRSERRPATVSAGADWGNLRYGKGFRSEANLETLRPYLRRQKPLQVLDVGASRGAFALALRQEWPHAKITGIEPDERVVEGWARLPEMTWVHARLEDTRLADDTFDLIYSCHTLEHVRSAKHALALHHAALAPDGYLFVEVPNLAVINSVDIVEEFFIDKHLYHFSHRTLARMLTACGFRAIAIADPRDTANISVIAVKTEIPTGAVPLDPQEVQSSAALISNYHVQRMLNMKALSHVARIIHGMSPKRVAIWGAGRLLNSLIEHGGLKAETLSAVVDKNLIRYATEVHGLKLTAPEELSTIRPDVVVVMSRSFADEIRCEAQQRAPGCEVILYSELLQRAKRHAVAA